MGSQQHGDQIRYLMDNSDALCGVEQIDFQKKHFLHSNVSLRVQTPVTKCMHPGCEIVVRLMFPEQ